MLGLVETVTERGHVLWQFFESEINAIRPLHTPTLLTTGKKMQHLIHFPAVWDWGLRGTRSSEPQISTPLKISNLNLVFYTRRKSLRKLNQLL